MTTKPKTRKAPAAKRAAPKAATKQALGICGLIARWRFLEAEEAYLAAIAQDEESDAALCKHEREKHEIETKLSGSIPQDYHEARDLLEHTINLMDGGQLTSGADVMMLRNVLESLPDVFGGTKDVAYREGAEKMRGAIGHSLEKLGLPKVAGALIRETYPE
jgi:hypothetical protein